MCDIIGKLNQKTATVYKMAMEINGKFYSVLTDIEYKTGPVQIATTYSKVFGSMDWHTFLSISSYFYLKELIGKTTGYKRKNAILYLMENKQKVEYVILKMVLSGNLLEGKLGNNPTISGSYIKRIKKVEQE